MVASAVSSHAFDFQGGKGQEGGPYLITISFSLLPFKTLFDQLLAPRMTM